MSSELLRRAASLMRERAEAATPGPWRFTDSEAVTDVWTGGMVVVSSDRDPIANVQDEWYENDPDEPATVNDATHIASWHPAVALAVADWLDATVAAHDGPDCYDPHGLCPEAHAALDLARVYLGETA